MEEGSRRELECRYRRMGRETRCYCPLNWDGHEKVREEPLEAGKGQEKHSHLESPERNTALPIPWFQPSDILFGLPNFGIIR